MIIKKKIVGKNTEVRLLFVNCADEGEPRNSQFMIDAPNYCSGYGYNLTCAEALEWFESTDMKALQSIGEY